MSADPHAALLHLAHQLAAAERLGTRATQTVLHHAPSEDGEPRYQLATVTPEGRMRGITDAACQRVTRLRLEELLAATGSPV
jgi:hypothetical protein